MSLRRRHGGIAVAGSFNDHENDYEGRVERNKQTYFGFDLANNGDRVNGITAYLHYKREGGEEGKGGPRPGRDLLAAR